ncbi:VWA domain-containing protein [Candidatus Poribacteria bacterium]|nr:VWA domain-containing protein [Candidatus Poribacteria bacterium]
MLGRHTEFNKIRRRSAILVALILHLIIGIVYVLTPRNEVVRDRDHIWVEWVKEPPRPEVKTIKTKPPLKMQARKPDENLALRSKEKLLESSRHKLTEVARRSQRMVRENFDVTTAPLTEKMPDVMTDVDLRESETSDIGRPVSLRADGQGEVTGRVRVRGQRSGLDMVDSAGNSKGGLIGGGGSPGAAKKLKRLPNIKDKLGIIEFIEEAEGPQQVVFCLDVSASMQAAGLRKLELAIEAIKEALVSLDKNDSFNIITFDANAKLGKRTLALVTEKNIETVSKYLDRFTPEGIANRQGTNLLEAIETALEVNPSIIVLVTDGLPTAGETDSRKILEAVKAKNVNHASIYIVALEIDLKHSPGAGLLIDLAEQNSGEIKVVDYKQLVQLAQEDLDTEEF